MTSTATKDEGKKAPRYSSAAFRNGILAILCLALVPALLAGCGSSSDSTSSSDGSDETFPPNVVLDSDIDAQPEGSAGRALLAWWQSFQFADADATAALTSPDTLKELGEQNFKDLVVARGQGLQGVEVLDSTESGDTGTVRTGLLTFTPAKPGDPPPDEPTASRPATFTMTKDGDQWLFATPDYLQPMIDSMLASQKAQEKAAEKDKSK